MKSICSPYSVAAVRCLRIIFLKSIHALPYSVSQVVVRQVKWIGNYMLHMAVIVNCIMLPYLNLFVVFVELTCVVCYYVGLVHVV